jgi:hypothetical protein
MSSLSLSAPSDNVNVNAYHVYSRLFFIVSLATSLLAISFAQTGATWVDTATISAVPSGVSITSLSGSISGDLTSLTMTVAGKDTPMPFLASYLSQCVYTGSANQPPNCGPFQGLVGITIFVRVAFAVLLLTLAWTWFQVAETLLLGWGKEGGLSASRPALFLPLLTAVLLSVAITVAVPSAYSAYISGFINTDPEMGGKPNNTTTYIQSQRPGSSWYMTGSATVFLIYALYSLATFERKQGTPLFTCKASAPAAKLETA